MSNFSISNSTSAFTFLNTRNAEISGNANIGADLTLNGNFNNRLAEKTITLYSPVTFNDALADSYYALNTVENAQEGGEEGFALPEKSFIMESSVILSDVVWTPDFEGGIYLNNPSKPVVFSMGYQIHPMPSMDFNGNLTYDSTGFNFQRLNAPGVIFHNSILKDAEPKNGGGIIVSGGNSSNRNSNIGTAGTRGNLTITPMWIRLTVPGIPNICGKKITHSAKLTITLTTKFIQK